MVHKPRPLGPFRKSTSAAIPDEKLQRILGAVAVAAFVAVGSVYAGADETVTKVIAGAKSSFNVAAVVWVDVYSVVSACVLGGLHKSLDDRIAVRAAAVLGAD